MAVKSMTQGAPWKHILTFSFPIIAGAILQQLYNTADSVIVGNFTGQSALAAVGTTNTMCFFFLSAAIGFSAGNGVLTAQHFGAKNMDMVRRDGATGIAFMLLAGLAVTVAALLASWWIYTGFIAVPPEILKDTLLYFRIYALGLVFQFGYNILAAVLRSVGDSAATLYFLLLASVINIALDLWFIAGMGAGVAGAAWATNIAQALSMLAAWFYMYKKYPVFRYGLRDLKLEFTIVRDTFKIGWAIALQMMIIALGISGIQRAVNGFGQTMTAAFTVGHRIEMYLHLPCSSLATTMATFTGQNVGAKRLDRVKQGACQGVLISFLLTAVLAVIIRALADKLPELFALQEQAADYCASYLNAIAFIAVILSFYVPLFGVFQGTRHAVVPTVVALCALSLRVLVTYLFKDTSFFGHTIIWYNGLFGFTVACTISWCYYFSSRWQKNAMPD